MVAGSLHAPAPFGSIKNLFRFVAMAVLIQAVRHVGYTIREPSKRADALSSPIAGRRQKFETR